MNQDTWAQAESALSLHLREHPEVERALLESPLESLNGADLFLRATVLEERHGYEAAHDAYLAADPRLYTAEVRHARDALLAHVVARVAGGEGKLVDVATGRGTLLERLLQETRRPLVATDVSETVLSRVRARLGDDRVAYVASDARSLPFEDGSVATLVTHLGLANVAEPAALLSELRRVGSELVATHVFFGEDDEQNIAAARELRLAALATRAAALAELEAAGWSASIDLEREVNAQPTPTSELIPGVNIDGLPVAPARVTWCVIVAR